MSTITLQDVKDFMKDNPGMAPVDFVLTSCELDKSIELDFHPVDLIKLDREQWNNYQVPMMRKQAAIQHGR